jgi:hypothetical protein
MVRQGNKKSSQRLYLACTQAAVVAEVLAGDMMSLWKYA